VAVIGYSIGGMFPTHLQKTLASAQPTSPAIMLQSLLFFVSGFFWMAGSIGRLVDDPAAWWDGDALYRSPRTT
jgi:hypothetical protein